MNINPILKEGKLIDNSGYQFGRYEITYDIPPDFNTYVVQDISGKVLLKISPLLSDDYISDVLNHYKNNPIDFDCNHKICRR